METAFHSAVCSSRWRERMEWIASEQHVVHQHHIQTKQTHAGKSTVSLQYGTNRVRIFREHVLPYDGITHSPLLPPLAGRLNEPFHGGGRSARQIYLNLGTECALSSISTLIRRTFSLERCKVCDSDDSTSQRVFSDEIFYRHLKANKHSLRRGTSNRKKISKPWKNEREKKQINFHLLIIS